MKKQDTEKNSQRIDGWKKTIEWRTIASFNRI